MNNAPLVPSLEPPAGHRPVTVRSTGRSPGGAPCGHRTVYRSVTGRSPNKKGVLRPPQRGCPPPVGGGGPPRRHICKKQRDRRSPIAGRGLSVRLSLIRQQQNSEFSDKARKPRPVYRRCPSARRGAMPPCVHWAGKVCSKVILPGEGVGGVGARGARGTSPQEARHNGTGRAPTTPLPPVGHRPVTGRSPCGHRTVSSAGRGVAGV